MGFVTIRLSQHVYIELNLKSDISEDSTSDLLLVQGIILLN